MSKYNLINLSDESCLQIAEWILNGYLHEDEQLTYCPVKSSKGSLLSTKWWTESLSLNVPMTNISQLLGIQSQIFVLVMWNQSPKRDISHPLLKHSLVAQDMLTVFVGKQQVSTRLFRISMKLKEQLPSLESWLWLSGLVRQSRLSSEVSTKQRSWHEDWGPCWPLQGWTEEEVLNDRELPQDLRSPHLHHSSQPGSTGRGWCPQGLHSWWQLSCVRALPIWYLVAIGDSIEP